jgi:uncharacterized membrane protein YcaP (DUF421 family)
MDPLRIVIRVAFTYVMLLVLMRLSGKHSVRQSSPFDFTLSLIIGDMADDMIWAEVDASVFIVGTGALVMIHAAADLLRYRIGSWR